MSKLESIWIPVGLAISGYIGFAYPTFALWDTSDM